MFPHTQHAHVCLCTKRGVTVKERFLSFRPRRCTLGDKLHREFLAEGFLRRSTLLIKVKSSDPEREREREREREKRNHWRERRQFPAVFYLAELTYNLLVFLDVAISLLNKRNFLLANGCVPCPCASQQAAGFLNQVANSGQD